MWRSLTGIIIAAAAVVVLARRRDKAEDNPKENKPTEEEPPRLALSLYLSSEQFAHKSLFLRCEDDVTLALQRVHGYAMKWLAMTAGKFANVGGFVATRKTGAAKVLGDLDGAMAGAIAPDVLVGDGTLIVDRARVLGGTIDVSRGSVFLGKGTVVEPGATIKGPCIFGEACEVRAGTYVRGDVVVGDRVVLRGELKHAIVLDDAEICHTSYVGDSILGCKAHIAAHAVTANLPLFGGTTKKKFGAVVGDGAQLGAGAVTSPGVYLGRNTHVYPLAHVRPGGYGPDAVVKHDNVVVPFLNVCADRSASG